MQPNVADTSRQSLLAGLDRSA